MASQRNGASEFEILSFVENGMGSKIYDVVQKLKKRKFNMEVIARQSLYTEFINTKLYKHETEQNTFLVSLRYSFQTKSRNYFVLTHTDPRHKLVSMLSNDVVLNDGEIRFILSELAIALSKLHSMGACYGGIDVNDIMFDKTGHVLLKRTYCGQKYWGKEEMPSFDKSIKHSSQASSNDKDNDWLSLPRLVLHLSTNENCRKRNLGLHTMSKVAVDFALHLTNNKYTEVNTKAHLYFSNINWDNVEKKQLDVPDRIKQFVNGSLLTVNTDRDMDEDETKSSWSSANSYLKNSAPKQRSMSESSLVNERVEKIRKRKKFLIHRTSNVVSKSSNVVSKSTNVVSKSSHDPTRLFVKRKVRSRTVSENDVDTTDRLNVLDVRKNVSRPLPKKEVNRKTSIDEYKKRLSEITKVLKNNENMMENLGGKSNEHTSKIEHTRNNNNANGKNDTRKIYSESESIREILFKYGLLKTDVVTSSQNDGISNSKKLVHSRTGDINTKYEVPYQSDITTAESNFKKTSDRYAYEHVVPGRQLSARKDEAPRTTEIQLSKRKTPFDEPKTQTGDIVEKHKKEQVKKIPCDNGHESVDRVPIQHENPTDIHLLEKRKHQQLLSKAGQSMETAYLTEKSNITSLLLSKLNDIGRRNSHKYSSQLLSNHSSGIITPRKIDSLRLGHPTPVNLYCSSTASISALFRSVESEHLNIESRLNSDSFGSDLCGNDDMGSFNDEVFDQDVEMKFPVENSEAAADGHTNIRVWKPGKPDERFLRHEERKMNFTPRISCNDCGVDIYDEDSEINADVCQRCLKSRHERKEAIIELIVTEVNYGNDLRVLKEEFYTPMKKNGICTQADVSKLFLNLQELVDVNSKLCNALQEGLESCLDQDDNAYTYLCVGEVFSNCVEFFEAYDVFCSQQRCSLELLQHLEKKNEMLRIFLSVSSKENSKLRKMDLKSFLVMPVQRIMKYPLLLHRICKNTPHHSEDKQFLKMALNKIEEQIKNINHLSKRDSTSLDIRVRASSSFTTIHNVDVNNTTCLSRLAANILDWKYENTLLILNDDFRLVNDDLIGTLDWERKSLKKLVKVRTLLFVNCASDNFEENIQSKDTTFAASECHAKDAMIILVKNKSGGEKCSVYKKTLNLKESVVSTNPTVPTAFEITEMHGDSRIFVAEDKSSCDVWKSYLSFTMSSLKLKWRRRRHGMSNIMIPTLV